MDGSVLEEKSSFKMLGLTFSSKLDSSSYIISIAKTASRKIGALIRSMEFLSIEVALYLYKSTPSYMEYCCNVWAGAPRCYLEFLQKLQMWICIVTYPELFWADWYIHWTMANTSCEIFKICALRCSKNALPGPFCS